MNDYSQMKKRYRFFTQIFGTSLTIELSDYCKLNNHWRCRLKGTTPPTLYHGPTLRAGTQVDRTKKNSFSYTNAPVSIYFFCPCFDLFLRKRYSLWKFVGNGYRHRTISLKKRDSNSWIDLLPLHSNISLRLYIIEKYCSATAEATSKVKNEPQSKKAKLKKRTSEMKLSS